MKQLRKIIEKDLYRYYGKKGYVELIKNLIKTPGFKYMFVFRKCRFHQNNNHNIRYMIYKLLLIKYRHKFGYEIPLNTEIGRGFCITHFGSIAINPEAKIGENVNISKGVTIGESYRGKRKGAPIISDNVWIGPNASVIGKISIGCNVLIAPNSFVNFDVPSNSIVIGNPGKIIPSLEATKGYINNV